MNVVQVSFHVGVHERGPEGLLEAWPSLSRVATATARSGPDVTVVLAADQNASVERDGVAYRFVEVPAGLFPKTSGSAWLGGSVRVFAAVANARPEIIHVHGLTYPIQTHQLVRRFSDVPVLVQDHASRPSKGLRRRVERWGFRSLSGVAFTARDQAVPFVDAGIFPRDLQIFEVIEASSDFTPGNQADARAKSGIFGEPCILWVGRLDDNKDPFTVLDAMERLIPDLPEIRLWCVYSDAPLLGRVQKRIDSSVRLRDRVHLLGEVAHHLLQDFYRAADLFVSASHVEGSGFALLEAMACGTPPVVTAIPSFRKITCDGAVGDLFRTGDVGVLAERILKWVGEDRGAKGDRVRRHFERSLSYEAIGLQLVEAYNTLLEHA